MKLFPATLLLLIGAVGAGIYFLANRPVPIPEAPHPAVKAAVVPKPAETPVVALSPGLANPQALPVAPSSANPPVIQHKPDLTKKNDTSPYAKIVIKEGDPIPELFPYQAERDKISELATTYDAAQIPKIAAYLKHSDSMVREAARVGLIQIGDAAAVPVLTQAAQKAPTPEEAALLREAAEFLALPLFLDVVLPPAKSS